MNRVHRIKINEEYADVVYYGDKLFEVRKNDRGYQKGDIVVFTVVDNLGITARSHPLNDNSYEITYVLGSFYGLAEGYVAFGIRDMEQEGER